MTCIYHSLISREKKGVAKKIGSYVTDIQKFKIEARKATKGILCTAPQIFLNCLKYHCKGVPNYGLNISKNLNLILLS